MAGSIKNPVGIIGHDLKRGMALFIPADESGKGVGVITAFNETVFNDSTNIIKLSGTQVKLLAGKKYILTGAIRENSSNLDGYCIFRWYNVTANRAIGTTALPLPSTYSGASTSTNTATAIISPSEDTIIEFRITYISTGTATITSQGSMLIEEVEAYIPMLSGTKTVITKDSSGTITYPIEDIGAGIVETGSNTNGSWIKFSDGTMICWFRKLTLSTTSLAEGALYSTYDDFTFPTSFAVGTTPIVAGAPLLSNGVFYCSTYNLTNSSLRVYSAAGLSGLVVYPGYIATGRWK